MSHTQMNPSSPVADSASATGEARYFRQSGLSLIQVMVIFLIIGVLGSWVVNYALEKRCEAEPTSAACLDR